MSVFKGRIVDKAKEESSAGKSCTKTYKTFKTTDANCVALPFVLNDIMGLEVSDEKGIHPEDIIKALHGHVKEGYKFNPTSPLTETDPDFNDPGPNDKVHCLVSVVSASSISQMGNEVIQKMKMVRMAALRMNIPHVVVMTKIDAILCSRDKNNLSEVYKSRKIKEKMSECSHRLGPPMKYIFPVSNYYEETKTNDKKDVLILMALKSIAGFVQDYIEDI
ncbi:interferon-induced protein 44-like [Clarias gariepinus]|uniref:interferon-induced protein 44-like n=1 Tax=Clarias gariepinus TaxID=13013 RepID=UPI00234D472A|nr:interferon-induced protein 44-like [Clarias gariepinus]